MKLLWSDVQFFFASLGGWLGWFLGGLDGVLYFLTALLLIDYVTGLMCAILNRKLSSLVGFRGIFKKILIFMMVGVGHMIDLHVIGEGGVVRTAVIFFYCANEGISLLENAGRIGLPVPEKIKEILVQLQEK